VERFDAVLRDLVCFGLVVDDGEGRWRLRPDVAARVAVLAASQRPVGAPVVHIGTACARCHATRVTRWHEGRYLCEACLTDRGGTETPGAAPAPERAAKPEPARVGGLPGRRLVAHFCTPPATSNPKEGHAPPALGVGHLLAEAAVVEAPPPVEHPQLGVHRPDSVTATS
jgi:hypothetical protein